MESKGLKDENRLQTDRKKIISKKQIAKESYYLENEEKESILIQIMNVPWLRR